MVEEIVEICLESYTKAEKEDRLDDLEMIRELLDKLGKMDIQQLTARIK